MASNMEKVFAFSVIFQKKKKVNNHLMKVPLDDTFDDILDKLSKITELAPPPDPCTVTLSTSCTEVNPSNSLSVLLSDTLDGALNFEPNIRFVTFNFESDESNKNEMENEPQRDMVNGLHRLMQLAKAKKYPRTLDSPANNKDNLHNSFIKEQGQYLPFASNTSDAEVNSQIKIITNVLWFLDGRKEIIVNRTEREGAIKSKLPDRFGIGCFDKYQDWKKLKKKPRLDMQTVSFHSGNLVSLLGRPVTNMWDASIRADLLQLATLLQELADYMRDHASKENARHQTLIPSRQVSKDSWVSTHFATNDLKDVYKKLDAAMRDEQEYSHIFFDEDKYLELPFASPVQRYRYLTNISLTVPVDVLRYDPGGGVGALTFIWQVPRQRSVNEIMTRTSRKLEELKPFLPEYHTRAMKAEFYNQLRKLHVDIPEYCMRNMYKYLTHDASQDRHPGMDERIKLAIETDDPNLAIDLRKLNKGRPGDTFAPFFQCLSEMIDQWTVAEERRHGIAYMSQFLSIRDLIEQVKANLPADANIPSESTVTLAFAPPNTCSSVARNYTSKVDLKHKVQVRHLRQRHQDNHYCAAQYKYMRQMAVDVGAEALFLSADDKAKVMIGEPGLAMSSGVRGKKSIISGSHTLAALDHDMDQKASIVPSVVLDIDIPDSSCKSMYQGNVAIWLKDSVFQASTPFRFVQEIYEYWMSLSAERRNEVKVLFLLTDGGGEHRTTFESVKISLIQLFRKTELEMLVAARLAPGQSFLNPVERIMSIINIGLQNVSLERSSCPDGTENAIKHCGTVDDIRKAANKHAPFKDDWNRSLTNVKETLKDRLSRCVLKDKKFNVLAPALDDDVHQIKASITDIDPNLDPAKLQKQHTANKARYMTFKDRHCRERTYVFQVRRCDDLNCCPASTGVWKWLPDPVMDDNGLHYKSYHEVVDLETTDENRPSVVNSTKRVTEQEQGCAPNVMTGQNVRHVVKCHECSKPRCVYSAKLLSPRSMASLKRMYSKFEYQCGCTATTENHALEETVFTRLGMTCSTPVEWSFYSSSFASLQLCAHCGEMGGDINKELKKRFKTVLPLCRPCIERGTEPLKRGPLPGQKRKL